VKFLFLLLHGSGRFETMVKNFHNFTRISHVALLCIKDKQVFGDVLEIVLNDSSPFVSETELFDTFWCERRKVDRSVSH
jgi:hypothetical protein